MKIIRRALCALAFGPAFAVCGDFSWELSGALGRADRSDEAGLGAFGEFESDLYALSAAYYFDLVEDGRGEPYALATFFDPASRVSVTASESRDTNRLTAPGLSFEVERKIGDYSAAGQYLFSESRWYAGGHYGRSDFSQPELTQVPPPPPGPTPTQSFDLERYGVLAGKYFGTGATRLELSLDRSIATNETSLTTCALTCVTVGASAESISDAASVDVMHVRRFRAATYALLGRIGEVQTELKANGTFGPVNVPDVEPVDSYSVGAELYPVPAVGVRLGYVRTDLPLSDEEDVNVGASWFFRRNVGFDLTLLREDSDVRPRTERVMLRVLGRLP
ncbi:MAG TPA: hypothetical protein VFL30_03965 [Rhodanobacteraceae bacterium]|nr:hypothetical protein [Rhodanobacteraceae bacterium]